MTNRLSHAQLEGLVDFLEQNPGIAKGLLRTNQGKLETKRKWANLAISLNSFRGANKNGEGWAKVIINNEYWAEKKCALKKLYEASMRRTAGGTADNLPVLSALENRLVAVMGGLQFAIGDSRLAVNPFPQLTRPESFSIIEAEEEHSHTSVPVQEDTEIHSLNIQVSPIPSTSHNDAITAPSTIPARPTPLQNSIPPRPRRRRSSIPRPSDVNMEQLVAIEARRVEAELTTAQALSQLSENIGNIASALSCITNAISDVARKMPSLYLPVSTVPDNSKNSQDQSSLLKDKNKYFNITDETSKIIIANVYHYFEQEYEELSKTYEGVDLTPLSKFSVRTALATGVSESTVFEILQERARRNAGVPQKPARKRPRQSESSSEEDSSGGDEDDGEHSTTEHVDEPEVYVQLAGVKTEPDACGDDRELADPISLHVNTELQNERDRTSSETVAVQSAAKRHKGNIKQRHAEAPPASCAAPSGQLPLPPDQQLKVENSPTNQQGFS